MAFPTAINDQITDSVAQANTEVLGGAPAVAMGNLFVATGQALSNAAHNATNNQQQSYVTMQASTTQAVSTLLSIDTASDGSATSDIDGSGTKTTRTRGVAGLHY
ncbi:MULTISPECIES: RebB family R body protein [unclassified Sphingomonas]|uniref:RebB family R body protein n=1 Tax=unclassified Sphingomonas TaxID=196159 RepID=UPI001F599DF8|nr:MULTISPECIES: RebB family R body protein [unclassified Sphingomonas]